MLSAACRYGIRASVYLAARHGEPVPFVSIRVIAKELGLSFYFLTKILQGMTAAGLVRSSRGPRGGVTLARPPGRVTVQDIVRCLDCGGSLSGCVLGLPRCNSRNPCPLHRRWGAHRDQIVKMFARTTLAQLVPLNSRRPRQRPPR